MNLVSSNIAPAARRRQCCISCLALFSIAAISSLHADEPAKLSKPDKKMLKSLGEKKPKSLEGMMKKDKKWDDAKILRADKLEKRLSKDLWKQQEKESKKELTSQFRTFDVRNNVDVVNRARYSPVQPYRQNDGQRMTVDLPQNYVDLDTDFDGQVGLYEWIVARRQDLELFDQIDANTDGFLTPRELQSFDEASDASSTMIANRYERPRLQVIGGTWHLTARGKAPTREELPQGYDLSRGRSDKEKAKLHQDFVDRRMKQLSPQQRARIKQLWDEKQKNDPKMKNRGASFVQIMEYVANEKQR